MRSPLRHILLGTALALVLSSPLTEAHAQSAWGGGAGTTATVIADRIFVPSDGVLIAEGQVEALSGTTRLQASRLRYDEAAGVLEIEGQIRITQLTEAADGTPATETLVLADAAELDADLRNGLVRGARMMLDNQLQLAATQISRVEGRYSQLYQTTVSSCHVCSDGRPPLWQIRARRVIHDEQERQLYFENARMEVMGVPVLYLPRLRLPDPSQDRADGFLIPTMLSNSQLGNGLKLPYFRTLGERRDLLLTPFWSTQTRTLEFRYRQAFRTGGLSIEGALTDDDLLPDQRRGYVNVAGRFYLPQDWQLRFDIEAVSDRGYLSDYDYSERDLLDSTLLLEKIDRDRFTQGSLTHFRSLRPGVDNSTQPSMVGDLRHELRMFPRRVGGELRLSAGLYGYRRSSDLPFDGPDADLISDGRDVLRLSTGAEWRRNTTLPAGVRFETLAALEAETFRTWQDASLPDHQSRLSPTLAGTLRWPLLRRGAGGTTDIIEPLMQVAWTGGDRLAIAVEEGSRVDFDEGNLLSISRFPGGDLREHGLRTAYGVAWSHFAPSGWNARTVFGQIRQSDPAPVSQSSGLATQTSDYLMAGQFQAPGGWSITSRGLFDDAFTITKGEARASWDSDRAGFDASYVWLDADPAEDRPSVVSEWTLDGAYRVSDTWTTSANIRYDIASDQTARAGMGLTYTNECVNVSLGVARRFVTSTTADASTDFALTIGLNGFSARTSGGDVSRKCRN